MIITIKKLPSGYYHIRGQGPCNWAQPPRWPCSEEELRAHAFPEASEEFIASAMTVADWDTNGIGSARPAQQTEERGSGVGDG